LPLTALLIIDDADCAFTVLGVPIVEFQIRQAVAAGATHAVLLVGRMPAALLAATDLLRREGLGIDIARSVSDAIDFVHPDDRVLLVAPRVAVNSADTAVLIGGTHAAVLAVAASAETARLDIIDGKRRWTGWAAFDGRFLRDVGSTIGDWDLAPTILRKLLQVGGDTVSAGAEVGLLDRPEDRVVLETALRNRAATQADGLGEALVSQPIARFGAPLASNAGLRSEWVEWIAFGIASTAVVVGFTGWTVISAIVMLAACIGWRIAGIVSVAVTGKPASSGPTAFARDALKSLAIIAAGITATKLTGQWGCVVLAIVAVAALALLRTPPARRRNAIAMADAESSLVLIGLCASVGAPAWGLGLAALHAALSVGLRQAFVPSSQP